MSNNDNILKKMKNGMMLSCDTATLLITKSEFEKLGCIDNLRLKMHLASCKFCRRFNEQSKEISFQIKKLSSIDNNNPSHKLSDQQKERLSKVFDK